MSINSRACPLSGSQNEHPRALAIHAMTGCNKLNNVSEPTTDTDAIFAFGSSTYVEIPSSDPLFPLSIAIS
jgi:hypothetical protein